MRSAFHGGLTPPALALQCERLSAKQRFLRCTNVHSPKSGGRQPAVVLESRWCTQCDFRRGTHAVHKSGGRQPAVARRIRIGRHERHSSADRQRCVCGLPLQLRLKLPRGAYAPRSCVAVRTSAGETTIFAMYKRTFDQERRASARRGWANTHRQTRAPFVGRPPTVCVRIVVAIAFKATTGGLRPPLLRRSANVCRRNNDFCDAQTYIRPGAAGVSPPWLGIAMVYAMRLPSGNARCAQERRKSAAVVRFPSATSEVAIPKRMSCSANRHLEDAATIVLTVLVAAYFRLFGVAGIEGRAERPKQVLKKCRQPTRRRTCRMTPHVYLGAR
jgi:hypothetical protein